MVPFTLAVVYESGGGDVVYLTEKARTILYDTNTRALVMEYKALAGRSFPLFNYDSWYSIDDWYSKLTSELERLRKEAGKE